MNITEVKSLNLGPEISDEQFIPDHVFVYVLSGAVHCYDGNQSHALQAGDYCLVRKNSLARYVSVKGKEPLEKVIVCFGEDFLRRFQEKHAYKLIKFHAKGAFLDIQANALIDKFILSLLPYYDTTGELEEAFVEVKYEELLIILLRDQPALANVLFDFGGPEKIDLEEFMNRNYKFNVTIPRFAYLTGRSLSAFKRDFKEIFHETPNRWLLQRRLRESYFLIHEKDKKPSEIYLELGFEDLSHFSFTFKKLFGLTPTELMGKRGTKARGEVLGARGE